MDEKFNRMPVSVIHLDKDGTVIDVEDYNLDKIEPNLWALKGLAAALLEGGRLDPERFSSACLRVAPDRADELMDWLM